MFCILLANLRKWVKIPYNLLGVNEHFEGEHNFAIKVSTRACAMSNRSKVKLSLYRLTPKSPC